MSDYFWLTKEQLQRLRPFFPNSRGKPRADDRWVLSGIICIKKNGLPWRDARALYGLPKTLYNRFAHGFRMGVLTRIFVELSPPGPAGQSIMIDSTHVKAHRAAASLSKGGPASGRLDGRKVG